MNRFIREEGKRARVPRCVTRDRSMIDPSPTANRFMDARVRNEPTISDIAQLARVSLGTVSNVLNGRPSVREDLALRVTVAASKLGYRRNLNAASLRSNQTDTIAVAVPNLEN